MRCDLDPEMETRFIGFSGVAESKRERGGQKWEKIWEGRLKLGTGDGDEIFGFLRGSRV